MTKRTQAELEQAILASVPVEDIDASGFSGAGKVTVAKVKARQYINRAYEDELNVILKSYPEVETKTWDKQEQEARAWAADNTATAPLLTEIANARGLTLAELVPRVIAKADAWMQLSGAATGKRQALEGQIEAATTVEEVEAIQW